MNDSLSYGDTKDVDYESFATAVADVNVVASADGVLRYVSPRCRRVFGWDSIDLVGRPADNYVHPDDLDAVHAARRNLREGEVSSVSFRFRCRDDTFRWVETTSRLVNVNKTFALVSSLRDITERQKREAMLEQRAVTDPLTGVANRTMLMDRLNQGLRRLKRSIGVLGVLYVDLDRFKVINDSLGHNAGDYILLQIADRLSRHLRSSDTIARLGGDEFVIVVDAADNEQSIRELAERMVESGRESFQVGGEAYECTLSVGVACTTDSERGAADLLGEADLALYRAKERGRDQADFFDERLHTKALSRLTTERLVRRALAEDRIFVEYQPIVDLRDWRYVGVEALVRIDDSDKGTLLPAAFLETAEEAGLLVEIDERVLTDAVAHAAAWRDDLSVSDLLGVSVNVTARHLADINFPTSIIDRCARAGITPGSLSIEVTERVLIEASRSALTALRALRASGLRVGLDDFGTGYSSLSYLRQFPLDFLKIDRSFIVDLERGVPERAIVVAIIRLAHALGLAVVAEGVETLEQLHVLQELDCDFAQGFLFVPSVPADSVSVAIAAGPPPRLRG